MSSVRKNTNLSTSGAKQTNQSRLQPRTSTLSSSANRNNHVAASKNVQHSKTESTCKPLKSEPIVDSEPSANDVNSVYSEVVDIIVNNTNCDRKVAEKTFVEIGQLINSTVTCNLNDALTQEVVAKLFHVTVDPEKSLLSSISFALTTISNNNTDISSSNDNGAAATPPTADTPSGDISSSQGAIEEDGIKVSLPHMQNSVYDNAKSMDELVQLMNENWSQILSNISFSANQTSVLPLVDYLSLYVTTSVAATQSNKNNNNNNSSETLDVIIGFILDIITCCDHACAHIVHNVTLFNIALDYRLSSSKCWSELAIIMLLQGGSQLSNTVTMEQCSSVLSDVIASDTSPDIIIPLILALNLGFLYPSQNTFLNAFINSGCFESTDFFLAQLIALFNRNIDPLLQYNQKRPKSGESNSVLKLMIDIFSSKQAIKKIYTNDLKVVLDVILSSMSNLIPGSQERVDMMSLLDLAVKNVEIMQQEPKYKLESFLSLVQPISEQIDCLEEALIARSILSNLN